MNSSLEIILLSLPFLGVIVATIAYLIRFIWKQRKSHTIIKFAWEIIFLPFSFSKIFKQHKKEKQLPLYFQYFLKFTRFCSRIPYFHFLPKFLIASIAEFLIHSITGETLLTSLIFTWSFSFFLLITIVESMHGSFNEEVITLANKLFLFSVSVLFLFAVVLWMFFWDITKPILENSFFKVISHIAEYFNNMLIDGGIWLWHLPLWGKASIILIIVIYIYSSLYLSKKGIE